MFKTALWAAQAVWIPGTMIWVDFPFPTVPEHLGYWAETLFPIYSQLADRSWNRHLPGHEHITGVCMVTMRRGQLNVRIWTP